MKKNSGLKSLRFKMPVIIVTMVTLATAILIINVITVGKDSIKKTALAGLMTTSEGYNLVFGTWFKDQVSFLHTYSMLSRVTAYFEDRTEANLEGAISALKEASSKNGYVVNIGLARSDGTIDIDSANRDLKGKRISEFQAKAWEDLSKNGYDYAFADKITKSVINDNNILFVMSGVKNARNELIAIIYMSLDWELFVKENVSKIKIGKTGKIFAIDRDLNIIMDTDLDLINTKAPDTFKETIASSLPGGTISYEINGTKKEAGWYHFYDKSIPWVLGVAMNSSEIFEANNFLIISGIVIGIITTIIIAVVIIIFARTITRPLGLIVKQANIIAEGDLITDNTSSIKRKDELGDLTTAFNIMREKLISTITVVNESINNIKSASEELAQGNTDLAHRTESQAASLEETASSMEQMASTIKSSADHSIEGNKMMKESENAIENAGNIITTTTTNIEEVFEASSKIADITKIIENIAFQTNILALNAAVEAARAGEQGRGFAVVASEVRNLAQTTQTSVKDITQLIQDANEKIKRATESARESREIFIEIQQKIENTSSIMQNISATALEQQSGVDQVNKAVTEMDMATQQNAALVEEATASSESLFSQAQELADAMKFFKFNKDEIIKTDNDNKKNTEIKKEKTVTSKPHHSEYKVKNDNDFGKVSENETSEDDGFENF